MMRLREVLRRGRGTAVALTCLMALIPWGILVVPAQEQPARPGGFPVAPVFPAHDESLDLFAREIGGGGSQGSSLRILRYGHRGTLERPGVLDIPEVGRAFVLHVYDLVSPLSRTVELRRMPDYRAWLEIAGGSHAITLSERWVELLYGSVVWRSVDSGSETSQPVLSAGSLIVTGRGRVRVQRINHDRDRLSLVVETGRFEVSRGETSVAVLGAGQTREFLVDVGADAAAADAAAGGNRAGGNGAAARAGGFYEAYRRGRDDLAAAVEDATLQLYHGPLSGDALTTLWAGVSRFGPLFASAESRALPEITDPDVDMRTLGEALRLLGSFQFQPFRRM